MSIFWVSHCFIINFLQKYWVEKISVGLFCSLFPGPYAVYYFPSFAVSSVCCPGLTGKEPLWHLLVQQGTDAIRADKLPWATSLLVWATQALPVSSCHFCVPRSLLPHRQPWSFSPMQSEVWFLEAFWIWIPGCGKAAGISAISGRVRECHHSVITVSSHFCSDIWKLMEVKYHYTKTVLTVSATCFVLFYPSAKGGR